MRPLLISSQNGSRCLEVVRATDENVATHAVVLYACREGEPEEQRELYDDNNQVITMGADYCLGIVESSVSVDKVGLQRCVNPREVRRPTIRQQWVRQFYPAKVNFDKQGSLVREVGKSIFQSKIDLTRTFKIEESGEISVGVRQTLADPQGSGLFQLESLPEELMLVPSPALGNCL